MKNRPDLPSFDLSPAATETATTDDPSPGRVADLVSTLVKSVRAHQIYQANNPVYQKFVSQTQEAFGSIFRATDELRFGIEETALRWEGRSFPAGDSRDGLAFLFYKDGVRQLTFLPGFEAEVEPFLRAVDRAKRADTAGDDLITLLWEQDFEHFRYDYVDVLFDGLDLPEATEDGFEPIDRSMLEEEADEEAPAGEAGERPAPPVTTISREDFEETLYFLDPSELEKLQEEIDRDFARDLRTSVLHALFDRLEDPMPARQEEILSILRQLLPAYLARGELSAAALILRDLNALLEAEDVFGPPQREQAHALLAELSTTGVIGQLIESLESGAIDPDARELRLFFDHLRPEALAALIGAAELATAPGLRDRLTTAIDRLAAQHSSELLALLESGERAVAAGAARLVSRLRLQEGVPALLRLLERSDPALRLAAVEALVPLRSAEAIEGIQKALGDDSRDVRMAAARGLSTLKYAPARNRLEQVIKSRILRESDLTERIAFFEAYGALGGAKSIPLLDRLLNGRGMLGRRQPPEVRACAALALGKVVTPAARAALEKASDETDVVVRSAVARALRREEEPTP